MSQVSFHSLFCHKVTPSSPQAGRSPLGQTEGRQAKALSSPLQAKDQSKKCKCNPKP